MQMLGSVKVQRGLKQDRCALGCCGMYHGKTKPKSRRVARRIEARKFRRDLANGVM